MRGELEAQSRSSLHPCPSGHLVEGGQGAPQTDKCPQASLSLEEKHPALLALREAPGPLEPWSLRERKAGLSPGRLPSHKAPLT